MFLNLELIIHQLIYHSNISLQSNNNNELKQLKAFTCFEIKRKPFVELLKEKTVRRVQNPVGNLPKNKQLE